jgi:hypothetical protein
MAGFPNSVTMAKVTTSFHTAKDPLTANDHHMIAMIINIITQGTKSLNNSK